MDHPCEKCAHPVEDGVPFCPHCRAPQIRVVVPEADPDEIGLNEQVGSQAKLGPNSIQWSLALPVCAAAGILAGFLMAMIGAPVLWALPAGTISVILYLRRDAKTTLTASGGARLGVTTAIFATVAFSLIAVYTGLFRAMIAKLVEIYSPMRSNPSFQPGVDQFLSWIQGPSGTWVLAATMGLMTLFFCGLGGAVGGAMFGRRDRK